MNHYAAPHPLIKKVKIGFIGAGSMTQALVRRFIESKTLNAEQILVSNRTSGKLFKLKEQFKIRTFELNEPIVEESDIVILAVKPQDLAAAVEPLREHFRKEQIIISLAAGINMKTLEKLMAHPRVARMMPNTPSLIGRGIIGFLSARKDAGLEDLVTELFKCFGLVMEMENEDRFDALTVSCASGTGFVFEMMMYWHDWIQEHGFTPEEAQKMTIETFAGASLLAAESMQSNFEELQNKVSSKKGVTAAGLESMRELEIERALRISFEKAALRSQELSKESRP